MPTLRLTQNAVGENRYQIEVALEGDGQARQIAKPTFDFKMSAQDQEDLRWYLEDYLQYPLDPNATIAKRIELRMAEIGKDLFKAVFQQDDDARDLWATLRSQLNETRVEIATGVQEAAAIPWELLRDPKTDTPLALRARAFVRTHSQAAEKPTLPQAESGPIRILLVICRPGGADDVPFRSVASRLIKGLGERAREAFHLEVLRPPTFEQLGKTLRQAKQAGQPYHVLHFDGHGTYGDFSKKSALQEILNVLSPFVLYGDTRKGAHGYLLFENPQAKENLRLVDGPSLGKLLKETGVPVLVLNACRSAHAETPETPDKAATATPGDLHSKVRALGSLAQEVMDSGVAGVVAMRYNVYVVTAAQFVYDFYAALSQGSQLGEAVTQGRKQLDDQPQRTIAYDPIPLQDWCVPVVYEAAAISLFPKPQQASAPKISLHAGDAAPTRESLDPDLPKCPDAGFFGRDETLLALDRAFDSETIVLLHAFAGSGKTATTAEFARWYVLTGGIRGPVLFTSFEQYMPLARVLDQIERIFGPVLEQNGINWLALDDPQRRAVALQLLQQIPVLWIWDNVEPVAGFPTGTDSAWSAAEQKELVDFLRDARDTKAKFLLTSRRDEQAWLGDLPKRLKVPPMPMQERVQMAKALAEKHNRKLSDIADWRPLLRFTQGNPLTITVLVGQALRDGLQTRAQIEDFVQKLRAGEAQFDDETSEGRARSLGASLGYGFAHAFSEDKQKILALLHFFQGFVNVDVLVAMGNPKVDWHLPEMRGLTREVGITLLDRAAEVGLLTALGGGCYTIHSALPWYFKSLFDHYYPAATDPKSAIPNPQARVVRAFVEAVGEMGNYYHNQYEGGNNDAIYILQAEEANLLRARQLARQYSWWSRLIDTMQGLRKLYDHNGRRGEWARLVQEIEPDFIDPTTNGLIRGKEQQWNFVTHYRVELAKWSRKWQEAEYLQELCVKWDRQHAALALQLEPEKLNDSQSDAIYHLASSLHELGSIQRELGQPDCVLTYKEAMKLAEELNDQTHAAICAFNLGNAYKNIIAIRDLNKAEEWYQYSLKLRKQSDKYGRAQSVGQLGALALERFNEAQKTEILTENLQLHLQKAEQFYLEAISLIPADAVNDLAVTHHQLGIIYKNANDVKRALSHWREAIRYYESIGNLYNSAQTRGNIANILAHRGRLQDAMDYARAALRGFSTFGEATSNEIQKTQVLIQQIQDTIAQTEHKK